MSTTTSGRRIAVRRRHVPTGVLAALVLLLATLLVLAAAPVTPSPAPGARTATVRVDRSLTVCLPTDELQSEFLTLSAPLTGLGQGGSVTVRAADRPNGRRSLPADRGALQPADVRPATAVVIEAEGDTATGRAGFGVAAGAGGLAVQECLAPRARWWFTGGGAGLDHRSRLVLVNVDPGPAVLDVTVFGPDGVVDTVGTRGLTLAPGEALDLDLVELAPQAEELSVRVEAARGRVGAGLADALATDAGAPAREWVPAQTDAARVLRLSPLPTRAEVRTLVVGNPSDREALVTFEVAGESGSFAPADDADLRVPPGTVVATDISAAVGRDASAVRLRSRVPVTATVRSVRAGDMTYASVVAPLHGPAAAVLADRVDASVHLTAGDTGGSADLAGYTADGTPAGLTSLDVAPGATARWVPPRRAAYVVVTPTAGRIFGGVVLTGRGLAQVPLRTLPVDVRRPAVVPAPR